MREWVAAQPVELGGEVGHARRGVREEIGDELLEGGTGSEVGMVLVQKRAPACIRWC